MRLNSIRLINFRGFKEREFKLHPNFNLIVGENGSGKTSILEAAAIATGAWLLGFRGYDSRNIRPRDVHQLTEFIERRYRVLPQYPVKIEANGQIEYLTATRNTNGKITLFETTTSKKVNWVRALNGDGGKTTQVGASALKKIAETFSFSVLNKEPLVLPLIRYFGAGRLWETVRDTERKNISDHTDLVSPFYGYRLSVDKRCNPDDLIRWMASERRVEIDEEEISPSLQLVYKAIESMLPESKQVRYSVKLRTLMICLKDRGWLSFGKLSDGYRNVIAIAADLAIKASMLNPQLGEKALEYTPGVVLIDELDLHLHPVWQRRIIEDLRRTFPKLQFICTTHSPFLIQSLRSGEELLMLEGQSTAELENRSIEEISETIMGVSDPEVGERYNEMKQVAKNYFIKLDERKLKPREKLEDFKKQLADSIAPYADNPAYQAFLELHRIAKLGE